MHSNLNRERYDERLVLAGELMNSIRQIKQDLQSEYVIVIGDMNESPYEKTCLTANGFHALPALKIEDKSSRSVFGKEYEKCIILCGIYLEILNTHQGHIIEPNLNFTIRVGICSIK